MAFFSLKKQYFDAIDNRGNCLISYYAILKLGVITIPYSSVIFSPAEGKTTEESSLRKFAFPSGSDCLVLDNKRLELRGAWDSRGAGYNKILWTNEEGKEVLWDCHHPRCVVDFNYKQTNYKALGYAETIYLPFNPLSLPVNLLRWGRFEGMSETLVWICWEGMYPLNLLYRNGVLMDGVTFSDKGVVFENGKNELLFEEPVTIREGRFSTIIRKYPLLKWMFSKSLLSSTEIKYKSVSVLKENNKPVDTGWALFEKVTFGV